jgi:thioesterase domain-containing protein
MAHLSHHFNMPLAGHLLLKARTVAKLARHIRNQGSAPSGTVRETAPNSALVELQRGNRRKTSLVMVHPIGGEVFFYRELAQALGPEQPVHAFQAPSLVGNGEPYEDIREQATAYVAELLRFQPYPPYLLGGASYGGVVAYEMAQQLTAAGKKVALTVLIDSPAPGSMPAKTQDCAEILHYLLGDELALSLDELRDLDPAEQIDYVFQEARLADRVELLPPTLSVPMFKTWMAHQEGMHSYQPQPYDGRVVYFRATEKLKHNPLDMHLPWIDLVRLGIEIYPIQGNHLSMNSHPHVKVMAGHLQRILRNLES